MRPGREAAVDPGERGNLQDHHPAYGNRDDTSVVEITTPSTSNPGGGEYHVQREQHAHPHQHHEHHQQHQYQQQHVVARYTSSPADTEPPGVSGGPNMQYSTEQFLVFERLRNSARNSRFPRPCHAIQPLDFLNNRKIILIIML